MNPRIGDKVRVSRTIVVEDVGRDHSIGTRSEWFNSNQWEIEVVEPRGAQVGDTIEGPDAYTALPLGAVVRGISRTYVRTTDGWSDSTGVTWRQGVLRDPRELVYLP